ncbi:MAG: pirin family protein [Rubrivivax sp.]|nr:pirin family protein [Rubrivivax sp.]MDP3611004.1 pirin family protein [Rubrivivax sp.]
MITLRKSADRGFADHGWLKSFHSFSFADYHDPRHMGVGNLRVINEDRIAAGTGFGTHGHRDMEIVSYVLDGALAHKDDMAPKTPSASAPQGGVPALGRPGGGLGNGNHGVIRPGDVQRMSAGTGVRHSEFNHDSAGETHFLQIWVLPDRAGIEPGYEQKHFSADSKRGQLRLVASNDGREGSVTIHADAAIHAGLFHGAERAELLLDPQRITYVHLVRGSLRVNGQPLRGGDALRLDQENRLVIEGGENAEVLVFDLIP